MDDNHSSLPLADVMGTGRHAAVVANVSSGKTVAVVGDRAVGLCGVIAAKRLGAGRIILLARHPDRIALGREFGATDVVSDHGAEAIERVRELTGGYGAHAVLECVGHGESLETAIAITRPGGAVGRDGVPQDAAMPGSQTAFYQNVAVGGVPLRCEPTSASSFRRFWRADKTRARPRPHSQPRRCAGRLPRHE